MKIEWDKTGERYLETGVDHGVLYPTINKETGKYTGGVAWNGLTTVTESPSGADSNDLYADNMKYASLRAAEDFGATVEAYTYPDEFMVCDGSASPMEGVQIYQQTRSTFGLSYRTKITNDQGMDSYKIHLVYGASASPSERAYATTNDSPDAISFSWELTTTPVNVEGYKPTALVTIDSRKVEATKMKALEDVLYGTDDEEPRLPLPDEVLSILGASSINETDEISG